MEKKIDVVGQMILGAMPIIITQLYAFHKIKKFKMGILIIFASYGLILSNVGLSIATEYAIYHKTTMTSENNSNAKMVDAMTSVIIGCLFPMYFARKWTMEYNEKIISPTG